MTTLANPIVGSKGLWKLNTPFDSLLPVNTTLTCTAISNYGQLHAMGIDVYETYYQKYGLAESLYKNHQDNDGRIVFVKTDNGVRYSFPLHYLDSFPTGTGINYVSTGILVRLGALPANHPVETLIQQIKEVCHLSVGVEVQVETAALSEIKLISESEHQRLLKARAAKQREQTPTLEKLTQLIKSDRDKTAKLTLAETELIKKTNEVQQLTVAKNAVDDQFAQARRQIDNLTEQLRRYQNRP